MEVEFRNIIVSILWTIHITLWPLCSRQSFRRELQVYSSVLSLSLSVCKKYYCFWFPELFIATWPLCSSLLWTGAHPPQSLFRKHILDPTSVKRTFFLSSSLFLPTRAEIFQTTCQSELSPNNADPTSLPLEHNHLHRPPDSGLPRFPCHLRLRLQLSLHKLCRLKAWGQEDCLRLVVIWKLSISQYKNNHYMQICPVIHLYFF